VARGFFITLEGGEGAGKSSQARMLGEVLTARGYGVVLTREPGGAPGAEAIRKLLVEGPGDHWDGITEALLHTAARREHLVKTVWPALDAGKIVISDRFFDSTVAYQGYAHGVDLDALQGLYKTAVGDFKPHLTLVLDLPVTVGLERAAKRGGAENRYESLGPAFHEKVRKGFQEIAQAEPDRCKVIDATQDIETIHKAVVAAVLKALPVQA
jgi:dTMP kinase